MSPEGGQSNIMWSFRPLKSFTVQSMNMLSDRSLVLFLVSPVSDHVMNAHPLRIMLMQSEALYFARPLLGGCETEIQARRGRHPYP